MQNLLKMGFVNEYYPFRPFFLYANMKKPNSTAMLAATMIYERNKSGSGSNIITKIWNENNSSAIRNKVSFAAANMGNIASINMIGV